MSRPAGHRAIAGGVCTWFFDATFSRLFREPLYGCLDVPLDCGVDIPGHGGTDMQVGFKSLGTLCGCFLQNGAVVLTAPQFGRIEVGNVEEPTERRQLLFRRQGSQQSLALGVVAAQAQMEVVNSPDPVGGAGVGRFVVLAHFVGNSDELKLSFLSLLVLKSCKLISAHETAYSSACQGRGEVPFSLTYLAAIPENPVPEHRVSVWVSGIDLQRLLVVIIRRHIIRAVPRPQKFGPSEVREQVSLPNSLGLRQGALKDGKDFRNQVLEFGFASTKSTFFEPHHGERFLGSPHCSIAFLYPVGFLEAL